VIGNPAKARGELRSRDHAGGHRLAVQPLTVSDAGFYRMSERVPEVEERAIACFALVGGRFPP